MAKRRKREYGEGSVYQRKSDGIWIGVLELGWANGKRQRKTVSAKTEREAWDKLDKLKKDHERGLNLMEPSRTVAEWLDMWLSEVKAHDGTRPATLTLYRGLADRYVKPVIGTVRLDRIKPTHIQRLISATRKSETSRGRPPSASTLRHTFTLSFGMHSTTRTAWSL